MRNLLTPSALALALAVSGAAHAQQDNQQAAAPNPEIMQGKATLQDVQQKLQQAAEQLRDGSGDQLDQAKQQAQQAFDQVRMALDDVPQQDRPKIEGALKSAEQAVAGSDKSASADAILGLREQLQQLRQTASAEDSHAGANIQVEQRAAQVTVQQPPPQVTVRQPAPEVTVNQPEPKVTVTQPKPQVTVDQAKPDVTVQQSGQAQVEVQQPNQAANVTDQAADQPERRQATAEQRPNAQTDSGMADNPVLAMRGREIVGRTLYGDDGAEVGDIQDVVISPANRITSVVVGVGGFLGIGESNKAIPVDRLTLSGNRLQTGLTKDEIEAMPDYDSTAYRPANRDQSLNDDQNL